MRMFDGQSHVEVYGNSEKRVKMQALLRSVGGRPIYRHAKNPIRALRMDYNECTTIHIDLVTT